MLDTKIEHEVGRLRALTCYAILGTPPEAPFDEICGLAAHLCETPIALVSFVEADRLWFKSRVGLAETHWPIDSAFCAHTIAQPDIFIVADTLDDQRFAMSPLVTGEPYIRFYAGVPLLSPGGEAIGTLCVLDRVPRQLGALQREALSTLGRQVVAQLELRLKSMQLDRTMFAPSQAIDGLRQNGRFDQVVLSSLREYSAILELPRLPAVEKPSFAMSINQLPWPYSGAAVSHTNVAARRLAEDALRHAKERISEFFSVVPVAISITSLAEDRFIEVNEYYLQLVGFERADLIGRTSGALDLWVRPEERAVVGDRLREHPSIHDLEVDFRMRSGEVCHGLAAMEIIDLHGEPCILAMVHDITERKRAEAERRVHAHQQKAVADLGLLALGTISLADLMDESVALTARILSAEFCKVLELLPDGKSLLLRAGVGWKDGAVGRITIPLADDAHASYTLRSNEPTVVEDLRLETRFRGDELLHEHRVVSGVSLIIHGQERPYGILSVHTVQRRTFSVDDVNFLQAIANVLSESIERKRRERYLEALVTVTTTLRVTTTKADMLAVILDNVQVLLGAESAALILRDPSSGEPVVEQALGRWAAHIGAPTLPDLGDGQGTIVYGSTTPEADTDPELLFTPIELAFEHYSVACIPLIAKSEVIGNLWVCREHSFAADELRLLTSISNIAANALHRIRLHEHTVQLVHQLHNQESFITRIVESTPSSLIVLDRALRVVLVNRNFLEKMHREKQATLGHKIEEIFPPVLLEYTRLDLKAREVFRTGLAIDGDKLAYRTPSISTHIYYYRLVPLKIEDRVENVLLFMDDITERERLGEEIRRVERHLASVVKSANDLVLSVNVDGSIMTWNRAAERVSGLSADAANGQMLLSLVPGSQQPRMAEVLDALRRGKAMQQAEINLLTARGQEVPIAWSCSTMMNDNGDVTGIVAIGRDLTEQRRLEAQLIQSTKMASLGVMAGGIAHELRNPLGIISASAQLLQDHLDDPNMQGECTKKIHDATKRASLIIENLLKFARPMTVRMQMIDVNSVLEETFAIMTHQLVLQQVSLVKHLAPNLPEVYGNPALLQQVFTNLILNACNAMVEPGRLTVATRGHASNLVEIQFEDTGCGIAADALPKIFDPFFTTRPIGKGTGLGLSISYSIIQQHRGEIAVRSAAGVGSTFVVSLPADIRAAHSGE